MLVSVNNNIEQLTEEETCDTEHRVHRIQLPLDNSLKCRRHLPYNPVEKPILYIKVSPSLPMYLRELTVAVDNETPFALTESGIISGGYNQGSGPQL